MIKELNLIIELDRNQHFNLTAERDKYIIKQLTANGYSIIRIYQPDIFYDKNDWQTKLIDNIYLHESPSILYLPCEKYINHVEDINEDIFDLDDLDDLDEDPVEETIQKKKIILRPKIKNSNLDPIKEFTIIDSQRASSSDNIDNLKERENNFIINPQSSNSNNLKGKGKFIIKPKIINSNLEQIKDIELINSPLSNNSKGKGKFVMRPKT